MVEIISQLFLIGGLFLAQLPASNNYKIHNYGFGSGGTTNSSSSNYSINAISGEQSGQPVNSSTYTAKSGNNQVQQANVPSAPTFDNPSNYYSRLRIIIGTANNPSDATFAIAITKDNWATTQYVQNDGTVGTNLGIEDYQTYAAWGGAAGSYVTGLDHSTTYKVKVKAMHGKFTETGYGPEASAATSPPTLAFDIDVASTDIETSPPYEINMGSLLAGNVNTSSSLVWIDVDTNGEYGAKVFISGQNGGLNSAAVGYTISSATADLSSAALGFGIMSLSTSQSAGGPLTVAAPYNGTGDSVGITDGVLRQIYVSTGQITSGRGSFALKAKSESTTPSSHDYREVLTVIAAASF